MKRHRTFWKWLVLWARAVAIEEARKKRIIRENLDAWNRNNRTFIRKCEREDAIIARKRTDNWFNGGNCYNITGEKISDSDDGCAF